MHCLIFCFIVLFTITADSFFVGITATRHRLFSSLEGSSNDVSFKVRLSADMKEAMKAKNKVQLGAIRAIQTAIKQKEVDDRVELDDTMIINILSKLVKQRRESIKSYLEANRQDLVEIEQAELDTIEKYLPKQLTEEEVEVLIDKCIVAASASTIKDMGKVMNLLRPLLTGKADMSNVGEKIKAKLSTPKTS